MNYKSTIALADITPKYLRDNYLTGLVLLVSGVPMADPIYEEKLNNALSRVQDLTMVDIVPRVIVAEEHDYHANDYLRFAYVKVNRRPVRSVQQVRAVYPTGQSIQTFPNEWVKLDPNGGQINLVPTAGTLSQVIIGQGGDFLPLIYGAVQYMPHLWQIDYTSGLCDGTSDIPRTVAEAICKMACIELLQVASDTIRPPGQTSNSLSVDGLSQSRGYNSPAFKARLDAYRADLGLPMNPSAFSGGQVELAPGLLRQLRDTYFGIELTSL